MKPRKPKAPHKSLPDKSLPDKALLGSGTTPRVKAPPPSLRPDAAFDTWLQRGLHELYDGVAKEPIPEELLRLLDPNRTK